MYGHNEGDIALMDSPLDEIRWTVFDLEATGINPDAGDRIIEIAAVQLYEKFALKKDMEFCSYVEPGRDIPLQSTQIHGITNKDVAHAPDFVSVFYDFMDFARGTVLVAHNAAKDMALIRASLSDYMIQPSLGPVVDSLKLSRIFNDTEKHDLKSLSEKFHMDKSVKGEQHRALPDAKRTAILFRNIMKKIFPNECLLLNELLYMLNRW